MGRVMRLFPNCFGIDVSQEMLDLNPFKDRIAKVDFTTMKIPKEQYDVVFLLRVILHLRGEELERTLLRCSDCLKKDGFMIIDTIPSSLYADEIVWKMKRVYWFLTGKLSPVSAKAITEPKFKHILDKLGFKYKTYYALEQNIREQGEKKHKKVIFKVYKK